jgi:hypothetical protein
MISDDVSISNTVNFNTNSPDSIDTITSPLTERRSPRTKRKSNVLPPPSLGQDSEDEATVIGRDESDPNYKEETDDEDDDSDALDVETRQDPILSNIRKQLHRKKTLTKIRKMPMTTVYKNQIKNQSRKQTRNNVSIQVKLAKRRNQVIVSIQA